MELRKLIIPESFNEILKVYRDYKQLIFSLWCNMHYHELKIAKQSMINHINSIVKSNDPQKSIKVCIGIRILGKIQPIRLEELLQNLSNLLPCENQAYSEFISYIIAKFCKRHFLKEFTFISYQLSRCNEWLHQSYPSSAVTCSLQLLHWFAQFASSAILNSSQQFFDAIAVGQFHESNEVRIRAYYIASTLFERSKKGPLILSSFHQSLASIKSNEISKIHGSLLVLSNYAKYYPHVISDQASSLMKTCRSLMLHDERYISVAAIHLIIELGPLDPVDFRNNHFDAINYYFFKDETFPIDLADELIQVMEYFSDLYTQLIPKIVPIIPYLIQKELSTGFLLLKTVSEIIPTNEFLGIKDIDQIISEAPLNKDFCDIIIQLFENYPELWESSKRRVVERFLTISEFNPVHLNIISALPLFTADQSEKLYSLIHPLLNHSNPEIKCRVPAALFALNRDIFCESYAVCLKEILSICVSDSNRSVRLEILNSIRPPYSPYLSFPEYLDFFSLLVNDDSFSVRRVALGILGSISKDNPSMILPIFRRVLLDTLYLCDSSPLLRLQAQTTRCLTMIIQFADSILPIYLHVYIPVAFSYLQSRYGRKSNNMQMDTNFSSSSGLTSSHSGLTNYALSASSSAMITPFSDYDHLDGTFNSSHMAQSSSFYDPSEATTSLIQPIAQQTVFEQEYSTYVVVNFVNAIALSCQKQQAFLEEKYVDITNLLLDILQQNKNKLIAISCLEALKLVIDYIGPSIVSEFPTFLRTLFDIGSKFTSSKIHSVILKVYGKIGPVPPKDFYENKISKSEEEKDKALNASNIGNQISYSDFYLSVSASALLFILEDIKMSPLHYQALRNLSTWPLNTSPSSQPYFNSFVRYLITAVRTAPPDEKEQYFPLIHSVLQVNREWMSPFPSLFAHLVEELLDSPFVQYALDLIPDVVESLGDAWAPFLPKIVTKLLDTLFTTEISQPRIAVKVLFALTELSTFAFDYVFIILRQMLEVVCNPMLKPEVVIAALKAMIKISKSYDCSSYMSLLSRSVFQCITHSDPHIQKSSIALLISLQSSLLYETYKQTAIHLLKNNNMLTEEILKLINSETVEVSDDEENEECNLNGNVRFGQSIVFNGVDTTGEDENIKIGTYVDINTLDDTDKTVSPKTKNVLDDNPTINEEKLMQSCVCNSTFSQGQWKDWCRCFILASIKEAPSQIIHQCDGIAQVCYSFAVKLFHAAFLSCWLKLSEDAKLSISDSLSKALSEQGISMHVLTTLVGLAEFMEKADQHMNISYSALSKAALRAEKLPFALFCIQKLDKLTSSAIESLFLIYSQLSMEEDVHGMVHLLRKSEDIGITPKLAEQLGDWTTALRLYQANESHERFLSLLGSLATLNDWKTMCELYEQKYDNLPATIKSQSAPYFSRAFYSSKDWDKFDQTIKHAPTDSVLAIILQCLANRERGNPYDDLITVGFDSLARNAGPFFSHGFSSLIPYLVQAEELVEIQEVGQKNCSELWDFRIRNSHLTFLQIFPLLMMRIDILTPSKAQNEILTLLKLARNSGEWIMYDHYFHFYYPEFDLKTANEHVVFEHCVSLWKRQEKDKAISTLNQLIENIVQIDKGSNLYTRALVHKAMWTIRSVEKDDNENETLKQAAEICKTIMKDNRKAHLLFSYTQLRLYNIKDGNRIVYAINAIRGYISCAEGISEMMELCSIFFRAGKYPKVFNSVLKYMKKLKLELWLPMIPQLFTQLTNPNQKLASFSEKTIRACLMKHHHLVIIPLLFNAKFTPIAQEACNKMLADFQEKDNEAYQSALDIYTGLLSACMTKTEQWLEALNKIGAFYQQKNVEGLKNTFEELFANIGTENSDSDLLFNRLYGERISAMTPTFRRFMTTMNRRYINSLYPDIRSLCASMKNEIDGMSSIPTRFVAPKLSEIRNANLAVLGTYDPSNPNKPVNTIARFTSSMDVFPSRTRPKRFAIVGSDGREFWYLLKGNEDLRLNQRVVQLFSLINTIIPSTMPTIVTNYVLPLSPTVGVIQWISGSDTMFKLIREFRVSRGQPIDLEDRAMINKTILKFDNLRPIQRLEAMKEVMEETPDDVLANIMWLNAQNSESWVKQISTFSKTSALMSVVCYIIGLGDRHASNLMIHKFTGSIIHVDLGECLFEMAKDRVRFPELIPFRLTRFMIKAFGPYGIDGSFRKSCLDMIRLIRRRREDVLTALEIFVHAPVVYEQTTMSFLDNTSNTAGSVSDAIEKDQMQEENINKSFARIYDKINGFDFDSIKRLSSDEQVHGMIEAATNLYNMAHLFSGWKPLW